jgi:hypothetical protein
MWVYVSAVIRFYLNESRVLRIAACLSASSMAHIDALSRSTSSRDSVDV